MSYPPIPVRDNNSGESGRAKTGKILEFFSKSGRTLCQMQQTKNIPRMELFFFFSFLISLTKETRLRERSKKFTPNISQNITTSSNLLSTLVFKMFLKFRTIHTKTPKSEYLEHSI